MVKKGRTKAAQLVDTAAEEGAGVDHVGEQLPQGDGAVEGTPGGDEVPQVPSQPGSAKPPELLKGEGGKGQRPPSGPPATQAVASEQKSHRIVGRISVTMLHGHLIRPSNWNTNTKTEEEYAELLREIRHLKRPPKPIVVREVGDGFYETVDGEHSWRAAKDSGLQEVPCEVIDVDDFEAMRQNYKRNEHGRRDPVRQGRVFLEMMKLRELSQRGLADEMSITEGTIRNMLMYAEAADLRNSYAPGNGDGEIAKLSVRQVREYLALGEQERNLWLDAGGSIRTGAGAEESTGPESPRAGMAGTPVSGDEGDTADPEALEEERLAMPASGGLSAAGEPPKEEAVGATVTGGTPASTAATQPARGAARGKRDRKQRSGGGVQPEPGEGLSSPENGSQGANESVAIEGFLIAWKKLKEEVHRRAALERLLAEPGVAELLAEIQSELAQDNQQAGELDEEEE